MICICESDMTTLQLRRDPTIAYVVADEHLADAIEPIMYKFLQKAITCLFQEYQSMFMLPE